MSIDFSRADAGMTEHLLYGQQIGSAFQQVCGEAVPEGVWADGLGDTISFSQVLDNQEDHLACKACATAVEENRIGEFGFHVDMQSCAFDVLE